MAAWQRERAKPRASGRVQLTGRAMGVCVQVLIIRHALTRRTRGGGYGTTPRPEGVPCKKTKPNQQPQLSPDPLPCGTGAYPYTPHPLPRIARCSFPPPHPTFVSTAQ